MKRLDFAAMENIQGGSSGAFAIQLPITTLLSTMGLGSIAGVGIGVGLGFAYNTDGASGTGLPGLPSIPAVPSLPLGL